MVAARMRRVAVISDVHANLHALEAVLAAIDTEAPDELWCLGDLVGYGARPNECCEVVRGRADVCLVGNHDLAVLGALDLADFTPDAVDAALLAREVLTEESRAFLASLRPTAKVPGAELFHGSARDPVWEYVLDGYAALATLELTSADVVLVGHSHVPLSIWLDGEQLGGGLAPAGTERDLAAARWLLNPGSVGQPRDGDPRAAWLLLDLDGRHASFRRVEYPVERTQTEIREAGLPEALAARLASGH
jgi:diadenosine tetraphosphatase ApaH/serine/threonine PP2A family protein phosphatase